MPETVGQPKGQIAELDHLLGRDWSFRVVSYEVRGAEVLVLGEVAHRGRVRQGLGFAVASDVTEVVGPLVRLAIEDALEACACSYRRENDCSTRRLAIERDKRTINGGKKMQLTDKQLSAIFSLARFRGLDQAAVASLTREKFTREPGQLDHQQAAQLISDLVIRPQRMAHQ